VLTLACMSVPAGKTKGKFGPRGWTAVAYLEAARPSTKMRMTGASIRRKERNSFLQGRTMLGVGRQGGGTSNGWEREREIYFKSHISWWEHSSRFRLIGRGMPSVSCFSAGVQISLFGLPQGKSPGPHMKDQESTPRPHTPRPAALPMKVEQCGEASAM